MVSFATLKKLVFALIALYVAHKVYWETTTGARRRSLKKRFGCQPCKKLPSENGLLIFGIDFIRRNIRAYKDHRLLEAWAACLTDNNAHTISMRVLGQPIFLTDDPENIKRILATDFDKWSIGRERIQQISAYLGKGIFTTEGPAWKHSREMLRPCFERSQVADISILNKHTDQFIGLIPKDGTTIDLQPLFHQLTLDIATEFLFGKSTNALNSEREDKEVENFIKAFDYCQNPFLDEKEARFGWFSEVIRQWLWSKKFKLAIKTMADFTDEIIDDEIALQASKVESLSNRYVFLNELLTRTSDRVHIRSELLNILLAGRDTTAALLSNVIWELSRQPTILTRLRHEIATHIGDGIPTYEQLKYMRYLKAILNESQRLYPIVPSNSREAIEDTILPRGGGPKEDSPVFVPKGAYVAYHSYSMHRRSDIFGEDANSFNPSRWLDEERNDDTLRPGWAYLPFNGGPRICIGQQFALTEAMFVVVRLLQVFPLLQSRDTDVWREKMTLTCTGLGGCKVGLKTTI